MCWRWLFLACESQPCTISSQTSLSGLALATVGEFTPCKLANSGPENAPLSRKQMHQHVADSNPGGLTPVLSTIRSRHAECIQRVCVCRWACVPVCVCVCGVLPFRLLGVGKNLYFHTECSDIYGMIFVRMSKSTNHHLAKIWMSLCSLPACLAGLSCPISPRRPQLLKVKVKTKDARHHLGPK